MDANRKGSCSSVSLTSYLSSSVAVSANSVCKLFPILSIVQEEISSWCDYSQDAGESTDSCRDGSCNYGGSTC